MKGILKPHDYTVSLVNYAMELDRSLVLMSNFNLDVKNPYIRFITVNNIDPQVELIM